MSKPASVHIVEVGLRDGLQNERVCLTAATRADMLHRLAAAGLTTIEAGSFVSPRWVPQMDGTAEVLALAADLTTIEMPVLVPNMKGLELALQAGARQISLFMPATDSFARANLNCSLQDAIMRQLEVGRAARKFHLTVRGSISVALHCPFEGDVDPIAVADIAERMMEIGCHEVALCDTTGQARTDDVVRLAETVIRRVGSERIASHFHDTNGRALANTAACLDQGITSIDSSIGGLGGCPYSPGAAGNLSTNKLVRWLNEMGIDSGVDLQRIDEIAGELVASLHDCEGERPENPAS